MSEEPIASAPRGALDVTQKPTVSTRKNVPMNSVM
jgi:hypothetical protein